MLQCLTEKFGRSSVIFDELKYMDKLISDSKFIDLVDHLEKLKSDVSHLDLLMWLTPQIKFKLPNMVQRD